MGISRGLSCVPMLPLFRSFLRMSLKTSTSANYSRDLVAEKSVQLGNVRITNVLR